MKDKLISELREWAKSIPKYALTEGLSAHLTKFDWIIDRHEAEQGEGLREAVKDVYEDIMLNEDTEYDDAESVAVKLGEILVAHPTPTKSTEPRRCCHSKSVVDFCDERCHERVMERAKPTEPLAVFCCKRGIDTITIEKPYRKGAKWGINLHAVEEHERFEAPTYALAESKVRAYLEALPDKGGK